MPCARHNGGWPLHFVPRRGDRALPRRGESLMPLGCEAWESKPTLGWIQPTTPTIIIIIIIINNIIIILHPPSPNFCESKSHISAINNLRVPPRQSPPPHGARQWWLCHHRAHGGAGAVGLGRRQGRPESPPAAGGGAAQCVVHVAGAGGSGEAGDAWRGIGSWAF